jgi:hypothetical protein
MTTVDLFDIATERYKQLKDKLETTADVREKHRLRLEIISILDVILNLIERMKHDN